MIRLFLLFCGLFTLLLTFDHSASGRDSGFVGSRSDRVLDPEMPFDPGSYVIYRTSGPIEVDGQISEPDWEAVPWTEDFVDINGRDHPTPRLRTRAKMLWDDEALYVVADLEEPHVWATLTERDAAVFQDNAFEIFLDPDGDSHNYYEFEVNALGTVFDLVLVSSFRDGGPSYAAWDFRDLRLGLDIKGTLNDPSDTDEGWTVEVALPWSVLRQAAPRRRPPQAGDQWRANFARSEWPFRVVDGRYEKLVDPTSGRAEGDWWVWAPQGAVDMHMPERWGYVQFTDVVAGSNMVSFAEDPNERIKWALRQLYYRQLDFHDTHGRYADDLADLNSSAITVEGLVFEPELRKTQSMYEITAPGVDGVTVHIRHDGRVWSTRD